MTHFKLRPLCTKGRVSAAGNRHPIARDPVIRWQNGLQLNPRVFMLL